MSQKQIELDRFFTEQSPLVINKLPKPSNRLSKKAEVCEMPRNAQFNQWVDEKESCDLYWVIWFPSGRIPNLLYRIKIDKQTYVMSCNCPSFSGGVDENGNIFPGLGFCSHTKRLRWTVSKRKGDPRAISLMARLNQSIEWLDEKKIKILEAVKKKSMTCDELEVELNLIHQTCSPLINWLYKKGFLEDSGDTRPTRSGEKYQAIVWQIP